MSTMPPNTPPGGGPPPPYSPYDQKAQWRAYREQQKAAWRAQRDAWRAQRYAWKANYVGAYGPRVPSLVGPVILIGIGVVALLLMTGHINTGEFWSWYGRWWPLLLIFTGLGLLAEWAIDMRRKTPVRRGGSFIGILFLLAFVGFGAAAWNHSGNWWNQQWNNNGSDLFNMFGLPQHDFDQQAQSLQVPANSAIDIENPRGDVSVTASDSPTILVQAHEVAYASSDSEAKKIFDSENAMLLHADGGEAIVRSAGSNNGRVNLTITVPKSARVSINAGKGDVSAADLGQGLNLYAHGDTHLNSIVGSVQVHLGDGKHDFSAHQIEGDLTEDGDCNDLTLSEVKGRVSVKGDLYGDVHVESIGGPVSIHTSRTDVQIAQLPGDLTFDTDSLRVNQSKGLVHVITHSNDVDLNGIYGDSYVENRDGSIAIEPAGNYSVEASNNKGDVVLTLPPNASATVTGHTHNGDVVNDYGLSIAGDEDKSVSGRIGSGQAKIDISTSNGDLHIKKGSAFPSAPTAASTPASPDTQATPAPPNTRHLKAPKTGPGQPVAQ